MKSKRTRRDRCGRWGSSEGGKRGMASMKLSSGFSWADEVEKEEQSREVERTHKRPNPFGSARPREVVLEEKGIIWKEFDQLRPQSTRPRKEEDFKENIPTAAAEFEVLPSRFKVVDASTIQLQNANCNSVFPVQIVENFSPLVPPLMYPPRNYLDLMKSMQSAREMTRRNVNSTDHRREEKVQFQETSIELICRPVKGNTEAGGRTHLKSRPRNLEYENKEMASEVSECRKGRVRVEGSRQRKEVTGINKKRRSSSVVDRVFDSGNGENWDGAVDVRVGFRAPTGELHEGERKESHHYRTARSGPSGGNLVVRGAADGYYRGGETRVGGMLVQTTNEAKSYQQPHRKSGKMGRKDNGFSIRGRYR